MKRILLLIILTLGLLNIVSAKHLKGGWIQYEYQGPGATAGTSKYKITVRQYLDSSSAGAQIDQTITLGIYDAATNSLYQYVSIDSVNNGSVLLRKTTYNPCIDPRPSVAYLINKYETTIDLPDNAAGYILSVQRCCRIDGIVNVPSSGTVGVTYYNRIPGMINGVSYRNNNSPQFVQRDTVLLCYSSPFTFDFSAKDPDGDSLSYTFCAGLTGASEAKPGPGAPANPPYKQIPYNTPLFDGGFPLGVDVTIDPVTGIISGTAPADVGDYVLSVCAIEYRNGIIIGSTKKEIHVTVANCSLSAAVLRPTYVNCNDLKFTFSNESTNKSIIRYDWIFGDLKNPNDEDSVPKPTHLYTDTGIYHLTLQVVTSTGCQSSTQSLVRVYPGFVTDFTVKGTCIQNPYSFTDATFSKYGTINYWRWDFGETPVTTDTSYSTNPSYTYPTLGKKTVTLFTGDSNGCTDSTFHVVDITDKPALTVPFKTALICKKDTIQLHAVGTGTFTWTPQTNIISDSTADPFVYPSDTLMYYVSLQNNSCHNEDSIKVQVVKEVTVSIAPKDTLLCRTDTLQIRTASNGQGYTWASNTGENIKAIKEPVVKPLINLGQYIITASIGKCVKNDTLLVNTYPYPTAKAAPDSAICYHYPIQLRGAVTGSNFYWSTQDYPWGKDSTLLNPQIVLDATSQFVLVSLDTNKLGCPKVVTDTIIVKVYDEVKVNAGNDTTVVVFQSLQLAVLGNVDTLTASYQWTTANGTRTLLNNDKIFNPIGRYGVNIDSITYIVRVTTPALCYAFDTIQIKIYKTKPDIFVPSGFTPNNDGLNDIETPVPVGILKFNFFNVYNRDGNLIFTTNQIGKGWDGTYKGVNQPSGTYVYTAQAIDYFGNLLQRKGTIVLIRN